MDYSNIQSERIKHKISQTKLAEYSGYSKAKISGWELKKEVPSEKDLIKIKKVLDELIVKIDSGDLNLNTHRIISSTKKKTNSPQQIKESEDYRNRMKNTGYDSEYVSELSNIYNMAFDKTNVKKIKGIGLFSGCGGLDLGFEAAGVDIVGHVEICDSANQIYEQNFTESCLLKKDINDISENDIVEWKNKYGQIDIIIGGPPCQGFSLAGKRNPDDIRNQLYKQYVRVVSSLNPKVFVFENVAKLTSMKDKKGKLFLDSILEDFSKAGYILNFKIINAFEYGVPQSRERVILVGVKKELGRKFSFEEAEYSISDNNGQYELFGKKPARTFRNAVDGLESLENGEVSSNDPLHWAIVHPQHVIDWLIDVPEGKSAHENPNPLKRPPSGFNTTYKRNVMDEPSSTISTNFNMISGCRNVHPINTRSLTIREAARIQSFPDEFVFCGNWGEIRKSIGNAVPPLLAYKIAKQIINQIWGDEDGINS